MVSVKKMFILFFMTCFFSQVMANDMTWSSPTTLSVSTMDDSSDPQIVMDSNGNVTAAWVENGFVYADVQPVSGSWSGTPSTLSNSGASSPRLGVDGSGNVTAIWLETDGTLYSSTLPLSGSWSTATAVSAAGATEPFLAVDSTGNAVAVWVRSGYVESSTILFGGSWSLVSMLSAIDSDHPHVSIGENGRVVAVWHTVSGGGSDIVYSAVQTIGGAWASAVNILPTASAYSQNYPKVSVSPDGNADAIWFRYLVTGGKVNNVFVYTASLPSGSTTWSFPSQISDTGTRHPLDLSAAIISDDSGNKVAVWSMSYNDSDFNIESATKPPGGVWSQVVRLADTNLYALRADLAVNELDGAVAAYMLFDGSDVLIQTSESPTASITLMPFWSTSIPVSTGANNGYPRICTAYDGTDVYAAAVWLTSDGTNTTIQSATGSRTPLSPPTDVMISQNSTDFGVFTDYYNTISWTASTSPSVSAYVIYRDGNLFTTVNFDVSSVEDHNEISMGAVTYSVVAIDGELSQSAPAMISYP